jgi:AcrR family transcriptional regulator
MSRVARKRERAHGRLLAAAVELIAEKGIDGLRVREITERADVGFGTFYNHFFSKQELVEAVVGNLVNVIIERTLLADTDQEDPAETAAIAHRSFVAVAYEDPQLARVIVNLDRAEAVLETAAAPFLLPVLERGIETGRFCDGEVDVMVSFIVGATIAVMRGILEGRLGPGADEASARTLLRACGLADAEAARLATRTGD